MVRTLNAREIPQREVEELMGIQRGEANLSDQKLSHLVARGLIEVLDGTPIVTIAGNALLQAYQRPRQGDKIAK